jgi:cytidylate kinase
MIVAIDGPAGGGKSALAQLIAQRMDFFLLNSGYFYRAITYLSNQQHLHLNDEQEALAYAVHFDILAGKLLVDGVDLTEFLHTPEVDAAVAKVSSNQRLRNILNQKMRQLVANRDTVCEGRDMTSVVFLEAELKIYLDASVEMRAKRRFNQEYSTMSLDEIQKSIQNRDEIDKSKPVGALMLVPEAWYIDSSQKSLEDVYALVASRIIEIRE